LGGGVKSTANLSVLRKEQRGFCGNGRRGPGKKVGSQHEGSLRDFVKKKKWKEGIRKGGQRSAAEPTEKASRQDHKSMLGARKRKGRKQGVRILISGWQNSGVAKSLSRICGGPFSGKRETARPGERKGRMTTTGQGPFREGQHLSKIWQAACL